MASAASTALASLVARISRGPASPWRARMRFTSNSQSRSSPFEMAEDTTSTTGLEGDRSPYPAGAGDASFKSAEQVPGRLVVAATPAAVRVLMASSVGIEKL